MWRAVVLAFAAYTICQVFGPAPASAVDSKGQWVDSPRWGWGDISPRTGAPLPDSGDCIVDALDFQAVSWRYGCQWGLTCYDQYYDLEPDWQDGIMDNDDDWDIDIKDLQSVMGRYGATCVQYWDPNLSMGEYSYKDSTPTGPGTKCEPTAKTPPAINYYVDPIGAVFFADATASRLEQEAQDHGFPTLEHDPEQRFWEVGRCTFEDVDARDDREWTCGFADPVCESWHFRAEVGAEEYTDQWGTWGGHVNWGTFAVATPHFDDDDNLCGHYVPQDFPYPDELYPGFSGSGFKAGAYRVYLQFVLYGGHGFAGREYWGNTIAIHQGCGDNQWPKGDGYVYYIEVL